MSQQQLLALDFDGVICDGLAEYFQTTCTTYRELWPTTADLEPYREGFYQARPIIESGWEMPVMLRSLVLGQTVTSVLADWPTLRDEIVSQNPYDRAAFAQAVDGVRDRAIAEHLDDWLTLHEFYPGVIPQLQQWLTQSHVAVWVISTKEGRFIAQLLAQAGVDLPRSQIIGKEIKQPKVKTLGELRDRFPQANITFIEDRLPPLIQATTVPALNEVQLHLADWGYNMASMRQKITHHPRIQSLSLAQWPQVLQSEQNG